ncbi:MAG TPA: hypothetical protein VMD91_04565 [Candidatus Sulfotelmatobacter sp.]|nr:hypothetical protein [Candidatus Sulfotelmatobacter sp.]
MPDVEEQTLRALARRTENDELARQADWPARVQLRAPEREKTFAALPYAFAGAFRPIDAEALRALALVCKLLRGAESLVDAPPAASERLADPTLRVFAAQNEALTALARLGPAPAVWTAVHTAQTRLAHALCAEEAYRSGRRPLMELSDDEASGYAAARGGAIRVALAGVAAFAGEAPPAGLATSVERYCEARQVASDLAGWRADLDAGRPTMVLARLARAAPDAFRAAPSARPQALARALFAGGVAADVAGLVAARADEALAEAAAFPRARPWAGIVELVARPARALFAELAETVAVTG